MGLIYSEIKLIFLLKCTDLLGYKCRDAARHVSTKTKLLPKIILTIHNNFRRDLLIIASQNLYRV